MSEGRLWTRKEIHFLIERDFFKPDERIELIEGEILLKVPSTPAQSTARILAAEVLQNIFQNDYHIRTQQPFVMSDISEPEPDIAVVTGEIRDYLAEHPDAAALLIEVSDSTLAADRLRKASLYARGRIEDYWVLNLLVHC